METTPKVTISLDEYNELLNIKKASESGDLYFAHRHYSLYDDGFNGKIYGKKELIEFFTKKDKEFKEHIKFTETIQNQFQQYCNITQILLTELSKLNSWKLLKLAILKKI